MKTEETKICRYPSNGCMKKLFVIPLLTLLCPILASCKTYPVPLQVIDNFDLLSHPLNDAYMPGDLVEVKLKNVAKAGLMFNLTEVELEAEDDYRVYAFNMPKTPITLRTTYAGFFDEDCGLGNHQFDSGVTVERYGRKVKLYTCLNCGYQTDDEKEVANAYSFSLDIYDDISKTYSHKDGQSAYLEKAKEYDLEVSLSLAQWGQGDYEDIDVQTPEGIFAQESHSSDYDYKVVFSLIAGKDAKAGNISVSIGKEKYLIPVEPIERSFPNWEKATEEDLSSYPEFKEILDSLTYHKFDKEEYEGIDTYGYSAYWKYGSYNYHFQSVDGEYQYDLGYLSRLHDSIVYPQSFPMVNLNPIGSRSMDLLIDDNTPLQAHSDPSPIPEWSISFGTIDPGCTNPQDPISSLGFTGFNLDYHSPSEAAEKIIEGYRQSEDRHLALAYPERFLSYKTGDFEILISKGTTSILGYFEYRGYGYFINCVKFI